MKTSCQILNGKEIAKKHLEKLSVQISELQKKGGSLTLASIRVGEPSDAVMYSRAIEKLVTKLGIRYQPFVFPENVDEETLIKEIRRLNSAPEITGVLIFSPLPRHLHAPTIVNALDFQKDVEGRRVLQGAGERVLSPTAEAAMLLIEETGSDIAGKEAVVVGRSENIGKPCAILLLDRNATVTVCHSKTNDLKAHIEKADIVVATVGKANLIRGAWIKPGATVIDIGENIVDGELKGDVEFEKAKERAAFISPVPGGVGPVTNVTLVKNLITLHHLRLSIHGNR